MFNSILVVCVGNICRSPTGEALLKNLLKEKKVASAGISALVGKSADTTAKMIASEHGISLDTHVAQQFTAELSKEYDLILVMEKVHIESICRVLPEVRGKVMLFGHWNDRKEIPDPYRQSREAFEHVYKLLEDSAHKWGQALNH